MEADWLAVFILLGLCWVMLIGGLIFIISLGVSDWIRRRKHPEQYTPSGHRKVR